MNHRTSLLALFVAGALAAPAAFAQDATSATDASQQTPPVSAQQSTATDASAASAAASDQGKTSADASGMAAPSSSTSAYDSATPTDQDKQGQDDPSQQKP